MLVQPQHRGDGTDTTSTDTTSEETETETEGEAICDAMDVSLELCGAPSVRGFAWDDQTCMGPDCDALYMFEPDLFSGDAPKNAAEHACWTAYIDLGCMTDPCDYPAGEFCVRYYDGTCLSSPLVCTPMPAGCEDNPRGCASGCPDLICDESTSECSAPPCGGEWDTRSTATAGDSTSAR